MTEERLFDLLLLNFKENKDFPKQQNECISFITKNLSDFLYDSLKIKSSANILKRTNVLVCLITK